MTRIMRKEVLETPEKLQQQLPKNQATQQAFSKIFKERNPQFIMTIARGSSDHAATYAKYLFETELGIPVASLAPSIITMYKSPLQLKNALIMAISQSGQSPDLIAAMQYARSQGALTLAFINSPNSPLAEAAEFVIDLQGGPEQAVAATKSFLLSITALIQTVATINHQEHLLHALEKLPEAMYQVTALPFDSYLDNFNINNALILGRGFGLGVAQELALKFKEVTQIHAEAFSTAEVLHGPFSLLNEPLPMLALAQNDPTLPTLITTLSKIKTIHQEPLIICSNDIANQFDDFKNKLILPVIDARLTPLLACYLGYLFIEALAQYKDLDPDQPPLIKKVTRTH